MCVCNCVCACVRGTRGQPENPNRRQPLGDPKANEQLTFITNSDSKQTHTHTQQHTAEWTHTRHTHTRTPVSAYNCRQSLSARITRSVGNDNWVGERGKGGRRTRQEEPLILRLAGYANKSAAKTKMAPSMAMMMCSRMWQKKETDRKRDWGKEREVRGQLKKRRQKMLLLLLWNYWLTQAGNDGKGGVAVQGQCIIFAHVATVSLRVCVCVSLRCMYKVYQ